MVTYTRQQLHNILRNLHPPAIDNYLSGAYYWGIRSDTGEKCKFEVIPDRKLRHARISGRIVDIIVPSRGLRDWCEKIGTWKASHLASRDHGNNLAVSINGTIAELCAALCLCSGFIVDWSATAAVVPSIFNDGKNTGRDLRIEWTGADKDIEIKSVENARNRLLMIRRPTKERIFSSGKIPDSYYIYSVLYGDGYQMVGLGYLAMMQSSLRWNAAYDYSKRYNEDHWGVDRDALIPFPQIDNHVRWDESVFKPSQPTPPSPVRGDAATDGSVEIEPVG